MSTDTPDPAVELELAREAVEQGERDLYACEAKVKRQREHLIGAEVAEERAANELSLRQHRLDNLTGRQA